MLNVQRIFHKALRPNAHCATLSTVYTFCDQVLFVCQRFANIATLRSGCRHVSVDLTAVCDIAIILASRTFGLGPESAPEAVVWADAQREGQQMRSCSCGGGSAGKR